MKKKSKKDTAEVTEEQAESAAMEVERCDITV